MFAAKILINNYNYLQREIDTIGQREIGRQNEIQTEEKGE